MYIKRGLFWLWAILSPCFSRISKIYEDTLGFWLYKALFVIKRKLNKWLFPWKTGFVDMAGKRSTLQIIVIIVAVVVMFPHTKLYSQDTISVPGQKTLLYGLIGPGYEDLPFKIEEVQVDVTQLSDQDSRSWAEGALKGDEASSLSKENIIIVPSDLSSISAGGTAISKPSIISGDAVVTLPSGENNAGTKRSKIVQHEVMTGDTIGDIAQNYGISVETILWANNLSVRSYIRPGDKLKILPATGVLHSVKSGETLLKIAKKYEAKAEDIIEQNRLQNDGSDIVVGEQLMIPGGRNAPVVVASTRQYTSLSNVAAPPPSAGAPAGSGYLWPTNVRRITQYYGWRHTGVDVAGPMGSPIYASRAGRVITSQCGWNGGYGCYIILDHGGGVQTLYGHNSKLYVSVGQQVRQGETIALMGSTGRSTGPHIHFEVRSSGVRQNPLQYVR